MKKSAILAVPLLILLLVFTLTPGTEAAVTRTKKATATLMHLCTRFCGCHHHHHGHEWCNGYQHFWCPGHH